MNRRAECPGQRSEVISVETCRTGTNAHTRTHTHTQQNGRIIRTTKAVSGKFHKLYLTTDAEYVDYLVNVKRSICGCKRAVVQFITHIYRTLKLS